LIVLAVLLVVSPGCSEDPGPSGAAAPPLDPVVRTTFYPTTYFAQRIGGGLVGVECPLPEGEDPAHWWPEPEVIGLYQRSRLVVLNGAGLESWAASAALARSRVVDSSAALTDELIELKGSTHSHGPGGDHSHDGVDGHTWMDPLLAIEQSRVIAGAMSEAFPEHGEAFTANLEGLIEDLRLLDARLAALKTEGVRTIASRRAYGYLSRRYGWGVQNLSLDPGAELTDREVTDVASALAPGTRGVVLWESAPVAGTAARLEGAGVRSVVFSSAANPGPVAGEGDYMTIMRGNIERLEAALGGG